jgi:hypothetical protein
MNEGHLCPNDNDWYRVASTAGSIVSVQIEMNSSIDSPNVELAYCGESGDLRMALCRSLSTTMQCSFLFDKPADTYCVGLSATGTTASGAPYTLEFNHQAFCGNSAEETNNGPARATAWVGAGTRYRLCKVDVDWFSYPAVNDGSANLELTLGWQDPGDGHHDITCHLYKEKGEELVLVGGCMGSKTNAEDWSQIVASNALTPGVAHYVMVLPVQNFGDEYDIEFTLGIEPK